ncbi:MAG: hypothetical protein AAFU64_08330, partial [Bacteroidota bacterium]
LDAKPIKEYQRKKGFFKNMLATISLEGKQGKKKVQAIYDYVRKNTQWNESYGLFPKIKIEEVLEKQPASGVAINLLLCGLLKEAGFEAYPAVISTKSHGQVYKPSPLVQQLNHVICLVVLERKKIFLDAIDPLCPYYLLPPEDLNESAFILEPKYLRWENINIPRANLQSTTLNLALRENESGQLVSQGNLISDFIGYYALTYRSKYIDQGKGNFSKAFFQAGQADVLDLKVNHLKELNQNFRTNFEIQMSHPASGDLVYLYPLVLQKFQDNPFNEADRSFPVDFTFPMTDKYYLNYDIPAEYEVLEIPAPVRLVTPGNGGVFIYNAEVTDKKLHIQFQFQIQKPIFSPEEYQHLKALFSELIAKINEPIVIKKKP